MNFSFLERFAFAVLMTAWLLWGSILAGNALVHVDEKEVNPALLAATPPEKGGGEAKAGPAVEQTACALPLLAEAKVDAGAKIFKLCEACHSGQKGGGQKVGPNLWDVVDRAKGTAAGFRYSDAMAHAGGDWTFADLDKYLASPKDFIPNNRMTFAGLRKADERAAVISYLRSLSDSPKPLP